MDTLAYSSERQYDPAQDENLLSALEQVIYVGGNFKLARSTATFITRACPTANSPASLLL